MEDEHYKRAAEIVYVQMRQTYEFCLKMQSEYGKWLISTLLLVHGAAIGGLLSKAPASAPSYLHALWWFIFGIVLALGSGFAAYWNFTFAGQHYLKNSDYRMLNDRSHWPADNFGKGITTTMWLAMACGIASVVCLIAGAAHVAYTWN